MTKRKAIENLFHFIFPTVEIFFLIQSKNEINLELGIEYANLTFSWNQTPCPTSQACNDTQNPLFQSGKMFQSTDGKRE